ncbi:MAG: response regulator transcription factor [Candidatus Nomurabacteria bacterium]|jgi:DNA-binding response OmpR family regulator|nr:response regulator transcription factor [Candidatus Nomurabacteria bacterium]
MKVLLVEDEPKIAGAIQRGLRAEGYKAEVLADGDSGLTAALGDEYDLMILDRMLPGTDGLTICREVRAAGITVPIMILTAKGQIRDRVDGLNGGADDYLVKPFSFEELLARIRALLRRPTKTADNTLTVKDLILDPTAHIVRRAGKRIELTATEFALLEFLMRNHDVALAKDKIISHVWDFDSDILPNTVEAYIGYLRKKLGRPDLIQTVRGVGYKIET